MQKDQSIEKLFEDAKRDFKDEGFSKETLRYLPHKKSVLAQFSIVIILLAVPFLIFIILGVDAVRTIIQQFSIDDPGMLINLAPTTFIRCSVVIATVLYALYRSAVIYFD